MTKEQFTEELASKTGSSKKAASDFLEAMMAIVGDSLRNEKKVTLTGFGTFDVSKRAARQGRNPQTGATIKIPAMKVPRFRAGAALKKMIR